MNKLVMTLCTVGLSAATVFPVVGEELFAAKETKDFVGTPGLSVSGENFLVLRGKFLESLKKIPYDPRKKYKLTCSARLVNGEKGLLYLGVSPFDAAGKRIFSAEVNALPKTMTTLAADASAGARELRLTDGSRWDNKVAYGYVVFNADETFADLPNRSGVPMVKGSVAQEGGGWKVELKKPLAQSYAAGTAVRQHAASDYHLYCTRKNLTAETQQFTAVLSGHAARGLSYTAAWKGTDRIRVLVGFTSPESTAVMELSELKLEELP